MLSHVDCFSFGPLSFDCSTIRCCKRIAFFFCRLGSPVLFCWLDVRTGNLLREGFSMPLFERKDMKKRIFRERKVSLDTWRRRSRQERRCERRPSIVFLVESGTHRPSWPIVGVARRPEAATAGQCP
uniref:Uncharacterized protein n=1 Tax=Triticum urartu TaxID=4572 RepID=A0A8R7Q2S8_TRIUA